MQIDFEKLMAFIKGQAHGGVPGSDKIEGIKVVEDIFNEPNGEHSVPSRSEIVTGPAEASSGGGAVRMTARYSDPAAQAGLTALYDRVDGLMREFQKALEAMGGRVGKSERAMAALISLVGDMAKAQEASAAAAKAAATPEAINEDSFLGKAQHKLEKARKILRKADMDEDEDGREERKSKLSDAADVLKSAIKFIKKADEDEEDEGSVDKARDTYRDLNSRVTKALAEITKAEEDESEAEKKEAAEKAKAEAEAAAKAKAEAEAAAKAGSESSEEDEKENDTAKSVDFEGLKKAVEESLKGNAVMNTTIQGLIDAVMSRSSVAPPPTFQKAQPTVVDFQARVTEAMDTGSINEAEGNVAMSILQRKSLAAAGKIPADQVEKAIASAPSAVREIFQAAA